MLGGYFIPESLNLWFLLMVTHVLLAVRFFGDQWCYSCSWMSMVCLSPNYQ